MHLVDLHGNLGSKLFNNATVSRRLQIPAIDLEFPPWFIPKNNELEISINGKYNLVSAVRLWTTPENTKTTSLNSGILPGPHSNLQAILANFPPANAIPSIYDANPKLPQPKNTMQILKTRPDPHYSGILIPSTALTSYSKHLLNNPQPSQTPQHHQTFIYRSSCLCRQEYRHKAILNPSSIANPRHAVL